MIELAAWTHAEFVKIHPFEDGNGRTSRLIMNYQLMANGFLPISILKENRLDYFNALESYAVDVITSYSIHYTKLYDEYMSQKDSNVDTFLLNHKELADKALRLKNPLHGYVE